MVHTKFILVHNKPEMEKDPIMKKLLQTCIVSLIIISGLSACAAKVKPEETVVTFLDAFKEKAIIDYPSLFDGDVSTMTQDPFKTEETPTEISDKMMEMILSYEYEILETTIAEDGLSAIVKVQFTTVNIGQVFQTFMLQYIAKAFELAFSGATEAQMNQLGVDLFLEAANGASKDKLTTVEVQMVKKDKVWLIKAGEDNMALFDGLMGGLITTMKAMTPTEQ